MVQIAKQPRVWTGTGWDTLAVTLPDLSNYSTTTQMNTAIDNAKGLVLVSTATIGSGVTSVVVNNCFSSTYDNYKIILSGGVASTNAYIYFSYNGITSGYYSSSPYILWSGTTLTGQVRSNQANSYAGAGSVNGLNMNLDVYNPFNTQAKSGTFLYVGMGTDNGSYWGGFYNATTTSQTGFTLTTSTGTLTGGTIRVYGYRNS